MIKIKQSYLKNVVKGAAVLTRGYFTTENFTRGYFTTGYFTTGKFHHRTISPPCLTHHPVHFTTITQKLTQGWLHALTVGPVELEKEIWFEKRF